MNYSRKKLANGLNVFMVHTPDAESVVFTILVKVGSRYETKDVNGVAHFLEHVFFKGSKSNPEPSAISSIVDAIGGEINASTSKEFTEFYIKAEKHNFDLIFETLTDMLLNPLFMEEDIEKEKGVVIEEINLYIDNPGAQVDSDLERIMWPEQPLGREILGTKKTVQALDKKKVFHFKQTFYQPNNIILGISGAFDQKHAYEKIKKFWGNLKNSPTPTYKKATNSKGPTLNIEHKKTQQAHIALGFKSFAHGDPHNVATFLLGALLGGSSSSRLWLNIREQRGWAYYVRAGNVPYFDSGNFTISGGIKVNSAVLAIREILAEIRRIKTDPVSEKELQKAKDYVKGRIALSLEDGHEKLNWILERFAVMGKVKLPKEFFAKINKITAEDILKVANLIFTDEKMSLAVIGPYHKKDFEKEMYIKPNFNSTQK